jgi:hypothetical protein
VCEVSLSLEIIKLSFSLHIYNFGYNAYSGNRNFVCMFVVLHLIFIVVYGMFVTSAQFVYVVKCCSTDDLYMIKHGYRQIRTSGRNKDMIL